MLKKKIDKEEGWLEAYKDFFKEVNLFVNLKNKKVYNLCADTHCYQESIIHFDDDDFDLHQYIVGTAGADYDECSDQCIDSKHVTFVETAPYRTPGYLQCIFNEENRDGNEWEFKFINVEEKKRGGIKPKRTRKRRRERSSRRKRRRRKSKKRKSIRKKSPRRKAKKSKEKQKSKRKAKKQNY